MIRTDDVKDEGFCETLCYMEPNCVSYNLKKTPRVNGKFGRELSNSTFKGQKNKLKPNTDYIYRGAKVYMSAGNNIKIGKMFDERTCEG